MIDFTEAESWAQPNGNVRNTPRLSAGCFVWYTPSIQLLSVDLTGIEHRLLYRSSLA